MMNALKGVEKPSLAVQWSNTMDKAFVGVKAALAPSTLLAHPIANAELALVVDAMWVQFCSSGC